MSKKLKKYWYQQGVKAGKTDGWMNLEETLAEDIEEHPDIISYEELVRHGIEGWEGTDHFTIIYGSKMAGDAKDGAKADYLNEEAIELYQDYKAEFWEGYLTGRAKIGIDVYDRAKKLLAKKKRKVGRKKAGRKQPTVQGSLKGLGR